MREIVLDTETTGLDPGTGHRIVEIGCVELVHHMPTGTCRQWYINPERDMPAEAQAIHGLSSAFLSGQPLFADVVTDVLAFLGDTPLVIHNAEFDLKFLNAELRRCARPPLSPGRVIDTLALARRLFPGAAANLDALCRRFAIDTSARTVHGALLDSQLLAEIYVELIGGREPALALSLPTQTMATAVRIHCPPRPHKVPAEELAAHEAFIARLKEPLWKH